MNKSNFSIFLTILFLNVLSLNSHETTLELRAAGFFHTSNRFKEIYDDVGVSYQVEAATQLNKYFNTWLNYDWYSQHGKTSELNAHTKLIIDNISCGIRIPYRFHQLFKPYIGIGPSFSQIRLKNKSPCSHKCTEKVSKWAFGVVLKTGVYITINKHVFFDLFVDYLYQPNQFSTSVDVGGVKAGIGIGLFF